MISEWLVLKLGLKVFVFHLRDILSRTKEYKGFSNFKQDIWIAFV